MTPGLYSIRLKLAEPKLDHFFERPMNLDINGRRVLPQLRRLPRRPRSSPGVRAGVPLSRPGCRGRLVLRFTTGWDPLKTCGDAIVQAIEVLPEQKSMVRIDAGAARPWIDWNGFPWSADGASREGGRWNRPSPWPRPLPRSTTSSSTARPEPAKDCQYKVPATPGLYTVHLKFAELWLKETAKRPMNIEVNGRPVWEQWDPAAAAGQPNMAADLRVEDIAPDRPGPSPSGSSRPGPRMRYFRRSRFSRPSKTCVFLRVLRGESVTSPRRTRRNTRRGLLRIDL